jgi:Swt1-like HEPN
VATNKKIKAALLKKLGVTPQRLSQMTNARKRQLPMSTEHAVYTIAFENEIDIAKELDGDDTAEVRRLVSGLRTNGSPGPPATTKRATTKGGGPKTVKVSIAGVIVGSIPALKAGHAAEAKQMSEKVYPTLYIFENSVRDLIERVLEKEFGKSWWTTAIPGIVQATAAKHKADEKKDPWHGRRGAREIDYVFVNDLWAIIKHQWKYFKPFFPNQAWVETLITSDMNVSRRVLAHMNPLAADDVKNIEAAFRKWVRQLQAVASLIP